MRPQILTAIEDAAVAGRVFSDGEVLSREQLQKTAAAIFQTDYKNQALGLLLDNSLESVSLYLSVFEHGAVAVPFVLGQPKHHCEQALQHLGCKALIESQTVQVFEQAKPIVWPDHVSWVMHSSGSTGSPKAIALTTDAVYKNAHGVQSFMSWQGQDLLHLGSMNLGYTNGFYNSLFLPLILGHRVLVGPVAAALKIKAYAQLIEKHKPDVLWVNPTVLALLKKITNKRPWPFVQVMISCTAPLTGEQAALYQDHFQVPVLQSYGLTETLIVSIEDSRRDVATEFSAGNIIGTESCISFDNGAVNVQNGAVTAGYATYHNGGIDLSLPKPSIPKESFLTQDLAELDEYGRLHILGRSSNVINVEGFKIGMESLEAVFKKHLPPQAVVVACAHQVASGEVPVIFISGIESFDTETLTKHCVDELGVKARPFKILKVPQVFQTANGKIDRKRCSGLTKNL